MTRLVVANSPLVTISNQISRQDHQVPLIDTHMMQQKGNIHPSSELQPKLWRGHSHTVWRIAFLGVRLNCLPHASLHGSTVSNGPLQSLAKVYTVRGIFCVLRALDVLAPTAHCFTQLPLLGQHPSLFHLSGACVTAKMKAFSTACNSMDTSSGAAALSICQWAICDGEPPICHRPEGGGGGGADAHGLSANSKQSQDSFVAQTTVCPVPT